MGSPLVWARSVAAVPKSVGFSPFGQKYCIDRFWPLQSETGSMVLDSSLELSMLEEAIILSLS